MYKDYVGKEIYQCYAMGGRINFQSSNISLCHSLECEDPTIDFRYGMDNLAEVYLQGLEEILQEVQVEGRCSQCSMRKKNIFVPVKVRVITLNVNIQCNCRCLYCCSHSVQQNKSVSVVPYIMQLEQAELIDKDCFFDFGGGEPTMDSFFEENLTYVSNQDYVIRVNTNALLFSETLASFAQKDNDVNIRISVDAGTEATYLRVKGNEQYNTVWGNIGKYRQYTSNIAIKYVLCRHNTAIQDLEGFVERCVKYKINKIYVDVDHDAYSGKSADGWSKYTPDMFAAAYKLVEIAEKKGIEVLIGYIWTARDFMQDTYDYNQVMRSEDGTRYVSCGKKIHLPEQYVPVEVKEAELVYDKYNNLSQLLQVLQGKKVVLYGAGYYGMRMMEKMGGKVEVIGVADSNSALWGSDWNGLKVMKPEELADMQDVSLLLTSSFGDEIMDLLNQRNLLNLKNHIYYMTRGDFDYYE